MLEVLGEAETVGKELLAALRRVHPYGKASPDPAVQTTIDLSKLLHQHGKLAEVGRCRLTL